MSPFPSTSLSWECILQILLRCIQNTHRYIDRFCLKVFWLVRQSRVWVKQFGRVLNGDSVSGQGTVYPRPKEASGGLNPPANLRLRLPPRCSQGLDVHGKVGATWLALILPACKAAPGAPSRLFSAWTVLLSASWIDSVSSINRAPSSRHSRTISSRINDRSPHGFSKCLERLNDKPDCRCARHKDSSDLLRVGVCAQPPWNNLLPRILSTITFKEHRVTHRNHVRSHRLAHNEQTYSAMNLLSNVPTQAR